MFLLLLAACGDEFADPSREVAPRAEGPEHAVVVHTPAHLGRLDTPIEDVNGATVGVACATCHDGLVEPDGNPEDAHGTVDIEHGGLSCASCHDQDRSKLHLADGTLLEMEDALELCAQCHGVQHRDWEHGSHGGMQGHWDLTQGSQLRNPCIDCHGPHDPGWGRFEAVLPPRDRGVVGEAH